MKKLWLNDVSIIPKKFSNIGYNEKVQLNAYKRLLDNEYLISIHDINNYSCI